MGETRLWARLLAAFLLAVGVLSGMEASLAFRESRAMDAGDGNVPLILFAVFAVCALACLFGAWRLWNRPGRDPTRPATLFGRNAGPQAAGGLRGLAPLLALPVVVLAATIIHHSGNPKPGDAVENPAPSRSERPAQATPEPAAAPPAVVTPADKAEAPVPAEPAIAAPPAAVDPPPLPAPPQQAAVPAPPPVTTAPLPQPPKLAAAVEGHRDAVVWLAVAPDGHALLSASTDRMIKLWDIDGKRLIRDLGAHKDMARTALFMPDGARALTAGDDGEIVLRSLADGAVLHVFSAGENGGANKLAIAPDGRRAVSGHRTGNVIVWDIEGGKALHVLTGHAWSISSVAVSPDGKRALTSSIDGELRLWDIEEGRLLRRWQGHEHGAYGATFTADGHHALTGSGDYTIKLWDLDTFKEIRRFEGHSGTVYALALSADGKRLASASLDGSARLWDMESGRETALLDPGTGPIYSVAFAADGSVLTGGKDRAIRRWAATGVGGAVLFPGAPGN